MIRYPIVLAAALAPTIPLTLAAATRGEGDEDEIQLEEASAFIEFNAKDEDIGIHFSWDGDAWRNMTVESPNESTVLKVKTSKNVERQGLTEAFFESDEPTFDEFSMEDFFRRFPEGEYCFEGVTTEGDKLEGESDFTHTLPAVPENIFPADGDSVDSRQPLVVTFDAVTEDLDGDPVEIELYEVIIESENDILRVFSIVLEGDVDDPAVTVPPQFLLPDTEYQLEVIAQIEGGNRTLWELDFSTLR